eukprot:SM000222S06978  [mRNA]  locus=s222:161118:163548:+ [translate_table: standard]
MPWQKGAGCQTASAEAAQLDIARDELTEASRVEAASARAAPLPASTHFLTKEEPSSVEQPASSELRVRVAACAVCRTDLHVVGAHITLNPDPRPALVAASAPAARQVDGELPDPKLPLVPGHQVVGHVDKLGPDAAASGRPFQLGDRVGVPWLGAACGDCRFCAGGRENLCDDPTFTGKAPHCGPSPHRSAARGVAGAGVRRSPLTAPLCAGAAGTGYQVDGGFAQYVVADARFCFHLPAGYSDTQAAPLLCAGLIGYRCLRKVALAPRQRLGIFGFGAAAHIVTQVAVAQDLEVYAFTKDGDSDAQALATRLGAAWAGASTQAPPTELDAAIIFAPLGSLVPVALRAVAKGGIVVAGGIHMSDIPSFPYSILWGERQVVSVANLTRQDAAEFLELAAELTIHADVVEYPLDQANEALAALRNGQLSGVAVLIPP